MEGFRLCLLHLVDLLQDVRKLLDHAGRQRWPTLQTRKYSGSKWKDSLLLDGDKLSQKRDITQALKLAAELGKE